MRSVTCSYCVSSNGRRGLGRIIVSGSFIVIMSCHKPRPGEEWLATGGRGVIPSSTRVPYIVHVTIVHVHVTIVHVHVTVRHVHVTVRHGYPSIHVIVRLCSKPG